MTWVPPSCTLPTAEQPLRVAEFDDLFATAVTGAERAEPGRLTLRLEPTPEVAATAARLAVEEAGCCSFFTFALTTAGRSRGRPASTRRRCGTTSAAGCSTSPAARSAGTASTRRTRCGGCG
jgi:hypothetical protein